MMENIFIWLMIASFVTFILVWMSDVPESIIMAFISLLLWLVSFASSLYIQVPYAVATSVGGVVEFTEGSYDVSELGIQAICLAFMFITIVKIIVDYMDFKHKSKYRIF